MVALQFFSLPDRACTRGLRRAACRERRSRAPRSATGPEVSLLCRDSEMGSGGVPSLRSGTAAGQRPATYAATVPCRESDYRNHWLLFSAPRAAVFAWLSSLNSNGDGTVRLKAAAEC